MSRSAGFGVTCEYTMGIFKAVPVCASLFFKLELRSWKNSLISGPLQLSTCRLLT